MKTLFLSFVGTFILTTFTFSQTAFNADSLSKHVYTLADDSFEGRSIGAKGGYKAAEYIVNEFKSIGIKPYLSDYYHNFSHQTGAITVEGKNIIGFIEGSNPILKNEYIVIGGHYDHIGYFINKRKEKIIFNGADDNASGVAAVIELGREILKNRNLFKRSIILVAFDGEESGLNGSKWMVKDSLIEPSQIKLMISIDMIGMLSKAEGIELLGMGTLKNGNLMANQVAAKNQLKIKKSTKNLQSRTDTKPFGDIGIPAIHITTGTISPYHKPEDDANLLDYEGMAQITEFTFNLAQKLAAEESTQLISAIATKDGKPKTKIFKPGVRFNMGSSWHKYPAEFYNGKDGFAIQTGLYTHINLVSRFSLQPEVLYETMGSDNTDGKFRTHAITTPVNILISFAGNKDFETWSYFVLGAYYTYNFAGKKGSHNIDFEDTFDPYEYGLNAGFVINMSKIQIGITRKIGLSNLYRDKKNGTIQNSAILGTLGFNF